MYSVFGSFLISSIITFCAYLFLTNEFNVILISSPIPGTVVIAVISLTVSHFFMSVFAFSSDAILQSFLLDEEQKFIGNSRP